MADYDIACLIPVHPAFAQSKLSWLDPSILVDILRLSDSHVTLGQTCRLLRDRWWRYKAAVSRGYRGKVHHTLSLMKRERDRSAKRVRDDEEDNSFILAMVVPMLPGRASRDVITGMWANPDHFFFYKALRMNEHLFHDVDHYGEATGAVPAPLGAPPKKKTWDTKRGGWVSADEAQYMPFVKSRGYLRNLRPFVDALQEDTGLFLPWFEGLTFADVAYVCVHVESMPLEDMLRRGDATLNKVLSLPDSCFSAC